MTNVPILVRISNKSAQQLQRQGVAAGIPPGRLHLRFGADDLQVAQRSIVASFTELVELLLAVVAWFSRVLRCSPVVTTHRPGCRGQTSQERFEGLILQPPALWIVDRILQRLDAVEDQRVRRRRKAPPAVRRIPGAALCGNSGRRRTSMPPK